MLARAETNRDLGAMAWHARRATTGTSCLPRFAASNVIALAQGARC